MFYRNKLGFNLVQLIVVMTVLLVLAAATFIWIDPLAKIGDAKNKSRIQDVNIIAAAISDYTNKHQGALPVLGSVTTDKKVLCSTQGGSNLSCDGDDQLCLTMDDDFVKYLGALPFDPNKTNNTDTGYYLQKDANGNLVVGSCTSYNSVVITKITNLKVSCDVYGGGYCWYEGNSANSNCNTECSYINLTCVKNVTYGPDIDTNDKAFCQLTKDLSKNCTSNCTAASTSTPPWFNTDASTCAIQTGAVGCSEAAGDSNYPICACN